MRPKTPKQNKWIKEYLATGNMAEATRRAGYRIGGNGGKNANKIASEIGRQNLEKLGKYLESRHPHTAKKAEETDIAWLSPEYVLIGLREIANNSKIPVQSRISALELLGKSLGLFKERHEVQQKVLELVGELKTDWQESG